MAFELSHIIAALGGQLHGDASLSIAGLASLESAGPGQITFLSQARLLPKLQSSHAACVIVAPAFEEAARARGACIVTTAANPLVGRLGDRMPAILEAGGSRSAMESFKAFRGREPQLDALLRHQGMTEAQPG